MLTKFFGFYGCKCHGFDSREAVKEAEETKYSFGQRVRRRCTMYEGKQYEEPKIGIVDNVLVNNFYMVSYSGKRHLEHSLDIEDATDEGVHDQSLQLVLF